MQLLLLRKCRLYSNLRRRSPMRSTKGYLRVNLLPLSRELKRT